ncbi:siderophore-interacting protein [Beutenbergia cavernae]|uniref:siderophore-interacting protein n=1 Tax=Beutenbergia cavernae TaxID=84757 RepID=UPI00019AD814|nr:siderophore-interacting protein [Beutenbergia cavernae]
MTRLEVVEKQWLTPHLVRLVFAGPGGAPLADFPMPEFTDTYVKLAFPRPGADYAEPYDLEEVRATRPPEQWPVLRAYTIRWFDDDAGRLAIDLVVHGDEGIAGPWAAGAEVGDPVQALGPGGAYAPDPEADAHLLVGDEAALPAIAAALDRLPVGARADVFVEVADGAEELTLTTSADVRLRWVHRACSALPPGEELAATVRAADLPDGDVHAFVHGDAGFVRELRSYLRFDRGMPRERLSISGYWRRGSSDEEWRARKRDWNAAVEAEETQRTSA